MQTKVSSSDLNIGMFVSSLDRPWTDTPFMFQGFLIETEDDIRQLQKYCEFVQVDWGRSPIQQPKAATSQPSSSVTKGSVGKSYPGSAGQVLASTVKLPAHSKNAEATIVHKENQWAVEHPNPKEKSRILPPVAEPKVAQVGNLKVPYSSDQEGFFSGIAGKMTGLFKSKSKPPLVEIDLRPQTPDLDEAAVTNERPAFIPNHIELSVYVDAIPVENEIAPAVKAHTHASEVLNNLVKDIQSNKRFAIEETGILIEEVVNSMVRNPDAMMWVTRLRKQDEAVYGHGLQVAVYLVALGRHLGLPKIFLERLCTIGLLLDIGKVKLPKELLLKKGRLSTEEFETVKSHVQLALDILEETPDLHPDILQGIAQHHERDNGSGYPAGLSGNEISLFGRMSAIVDTFSALTTPRSYAEAVPAYEALRNLSNFNPGLYQPTMIEQFIQAIGAFPVGSMVELSSGEVAVVISHSKIRRLKPRVLIISDASKRPSPQPATLDLLYQPLIAGQEERYIQRGLPTGAFGLDAREFYLS